MNEMYIYRDYSNRFDTNIYIRQFGKQVCMPNHSFGPGTRDHYLLHFVVSGKGKYYYKDQVFEVKSSQCFLICPDELAYYIADEDDPWTYYWIGFSGSRAHPYLSQIALTKKSPILNVEDMDYIICCLEEVIESSKLIRGGDLRMLGHLYILLSKLYEESKRPIDQTLQDDYIKKAVEYIDMNYIHNISISDIADSLNLNRSYFSSLFKKKLQVSPQNYLIQLRIDKACDLLIRNQTLSVNYIAQSVGYTDQLVFSKTFKKLIGMSPSSFRDSNLTTK